MDKKTNRIIALLLILCSFSFPLYTQAQEQKKQNIYFSSTSFSVLLTGGNTKDFFFSMDTVQNLVWDKHKFKLAGKSSIPGQTVKKSLKYITLPFITISSLTHAPISSFCPISAGMCRLDITFVLPFLLEQATHGWPAKK